ncbi:MAG: DEAD/DEAH box helicase [Acidimicrobiales bacterium]
MEHLRSLTAATTPDEALEAFLAWVSARGLGLYPAQEEAVLEAFAGNNVIVNTPTGSGKSLVALGAHVAALSQGQRSWYTAPIKALVSEKFFDLAGQLGQDRVGMLTGDASINPRAPVICATAEILAKQALRLGSGAPVDQVVMDEFHFYADPDRGWAWQVPLIELTGAQFLLMSATLGDVSRFEAQLTRRTGRPTAVVRSAVRPVPLDYRYAQTTMTDTLEDLLGAGAAPVYVVHFTQAAAVARAQALTSLSVATRAERHAIAAAVAGFRWNTGFGTALGRFVRAGIGVHHAGMLPRYRRLVERLAQEGLLKVICGTDTLGVGINVPIRTVVFTGLAKYDGSVSRILTAREFHQIAGRAGRAGYDTAGSVVVQAPDHVVDNARARAKAGDDPRKARKVARAKPPPGFVAWTEETFDRLVTSAPEPLRSSFAVTHSMLLDVLDRPGDGCAALARLLTDNDEARPAQRAHIRRAVSIYRTLVAAGAVETLAEPDASGRRVRVTLDLQADFALDQPLSPFVLEAVPRLDPSSPVWALDVVSVVESTLENPKSVLAAQLDKLRGEVVTALKADGVEYEARMEALDRLEHPKPLADFLYDLFDRYRVVHPWAADHNVAPKSVVRDLFERAMGFAEYVAHYGLSRSEGLVLRYLSGAYKSLSRAVPEDAKTEELVDLTEWLGELVRQVDSSLLDEWERLRNPEAAGGGAMEGSAVGPDVLAERPPGVSTNRRAFRVMVRNAAFRRVELLARHAWAALGELDGDCGWDALRWEAAGAKYFVEHGSVGTGAPSRGRDLFQLQEAGSLWRLRQVLDDPAGDRDWAVMAEVDLAASDEAGAAVLRPVAVDRASQW